MKKDTISLRSFERSGKTLVLFAVSLVIAPYYYTFLSGQFPLPWLIAIMVAPSLVFLGHALQSLFSRAFGIKPEGGTSAYEDLVKRFKPEQAALPIGVALLLAFGAMKGIDALMKAYADATTGVLYDPRSLLPFFGAALIGMTMVLGIVLWFYPYNRILSLRSIIPFGVVFLFNFLLNLIMNGLSTVFLAVCLLLFVPLYLLVLNQSYLVHAIDRAGTGKIGGDMLKFNGALSGVLALAFLAVFGVILALCGGVTTLVRMIFFAMFSSAGLGTNKNDSWEEKSDNFVESVFGSSEGGTFMLGQNAMLGLFLVFFLFAIAALGLFLLFRFRADLWRGAMRWAKKLISDILHFIRTALDLWNGALMDEKDEKIRNDYVDTSIKMAKQNPSASARHTSTRNWRAEYALLKTASERNRFLYRLLVTRMERFLALRVSDTPHQIENKAKARLNCPEMPMITETFVAYRYGGENHTPEQNTSEQVQNAMIDMIDRYEEGDMG